MLYDITIHYHPATWAAVSQPYEWKESLKRALGVSEGPEPEPQLRRDAVSGRPKFEMRLCELQCYLALLGLSLVLCGRSASSQLEPDLDFRHRRLLQRARAIGQATQDWTKKDIEELLSLLSMPEIEMRENDLSTAAENEEVRVELQRSAESSNQLPARERKAGCKNFYWKGFTSC